MANTHNSKAKIGQKGKKMEEKNSCATGPGQVSNPGPLYYEADALPTELLA